MQIHAKNFFKKPRVQERSTQTLDDPLNQTMDSTNSVNSSFFTINSEQTQKLEHIVDVMDRLIDLHSAIDDHADSAMESDQMLIHDTSIVTTEDNSFIKECDQEISQMKES